MFHHHTHGGKSEGDVTKTGGEPAQRSLTDRLTAASKQTKKRLETKKHTGINDVRRKPGKESVHM